MREEPKVLSFDELLKRAFQKQFISQVFLGFSTQDEMHADFKKKHGTLNSKHCQLKLLYKPVYKPAKQAPCFCSAQT